MLSVPSRFRALLTRCRLWSASGLAREHAATLDFSRVACAGRCRLLGEAASLQCLVSRRGLMPRGKQIGGPARCARSAQFDCARFYLAAECATLHRSAPLPAWLVRPRCLTRGCSGACSRPRGYAAPFVTEGGVARISYYTRSSAVLFVLTQCMGPDLACVSSPEFYPSKKLSSHHTPVAFCPTRVAAAVAGGATYCNKVHAAGAVATNQTGAGRRHRGPCRRVARTMVLSGKRRGGPPTGGSCGLHHGLHCCRLRCRHRDGGRQGSSP